ncbi:hypothetical protein [Epilithonimonas zeae]|uniref:hypothetical protein n=1 Tax=Epilithonimonas zeae TaxID=1416779 RepID=UPI00200E0557|nr:hypothetical protein [Epilithonimonas zeae]UQB67893.1 hypothetical protein KI430_12740 [Epilithonimonas zeae]
MMKIKNTDGLTTQQIRGMVNNGGKFVMYNYCISIIFMTFKRPSSIYFIPPGKSSITPGLKHLGTSLIVGWWGIPWGPIYTIGSIFGVLSGGKNITQEVMGHINQNDDSYGHTGYGESLINNKSESETPTYNVN